MPKRRTKAQKAMAVHVYQYQDQEWLGPKPSEPQIRNRNQTGLLLVPREYVVAGMYRTLIISGLILAIELAIYWYG